MRDSASKQYLLVCTNLIIDTKNVSDLLIATLTKMMALAFSWHVFQTRPMT